jgi:hypothetical protein
MGHYENDRPESFVKPIFRVVVLNVGGRISFFERARASYTLGA